MKCKIQEHFPQKKGGGGLAHSQIQILEHFARPPSQNDPKFEYCNERDPVPPFLLGNLPEFCTLFVVAIILNKN